MSVCSLLGSRGVFFGVSSFESVTRHWPNSVLMRSFVESVARQRPVNNSGVVFFLGSVLRVCCRGNITLLIQPKLQKG
jgi:hypothetical protein